DDPQVLLGSDVSTMSAATREALVASLLRLFDAGALIDSDWEARARYRKLAHPDLAEQLRPFISDPTKNLLVRSVAIDIAQACQLGGLQGLLADVALDRADSEPVREQAAFAVTQVGGPGHPAPPPAAPGGRVGRLTRRAEGRGAPGPLAG